LKYNTLLTTPESNLVVKPIVHVIIAKTTLTCTNCDKIGHLMETYHNKKREVQVVPTVTFKSTKPIVGTKTQPIKSR